MRVWNVTYLLKVFLYFSRIEKNLRGILLDESNTTPKDLSSSLNLAKALSVARQKITLANKDPSVKSAELTQLTEKLNEAYFE